MSLVLASMVLLKWVGDRRLVSLSPSASGIEVASVGSSGQAGQVQVSLPDVTRTSPVRAPAKVDAAEFAVEPMNEIDSQESPQRETRRPLQIEAL